MKRFLLISSILFLSVLGFSQSRYWVGVSGGLWSATSNWSTGSMGTPGASSPVAANDVIFDNGFTGVVEMDVLSPTTFTINSLLITANSTVTLQKTQAAGGTRILQLASTSSSPKGLQIDNGSTLTIEGINSGGTMVYQLALTGGMGVTGEISGNLYIKTAFSGSGGTEIDLQDDGTHYGALVVKNLGVIKYFDNTGNTGPSTGSYLTMESGSIYEINKNGGSFPPGSWNINSLAKVTGVTSAGPSFNGASYGNLQWNASSQTSAAVIGKDISFNNVDIINTGTSFVRAKGGTGATVFTMTINGNLNVGANTVLETSGNTTTSGASGIIQVKGNIINNGIIREASTVTGNQFELNGISNQNISGTGTWTGDDITFIIDNAAGATLLSPLTLPNKLALTIGNIKTTSTNLLTMVDNATYFGGSAISFIEGPMKKIGDDDFIFPVGVGSIYAPLGIKSVSVAATNDEFTAEYVRNNPQSVHGTMYESPLDHISYVEYWTLDRNIGSNSTKFVSLFVNFTSFCFDLSKTYVSRYDGTKWTNEGSTFVAGPTSGSYVSGTITSTNAINTFTPTPNALTLATDLFYANNPLPITLISFDASKLSSSRSSIAWELAACCSPAAKFEIQRAGSDKSFVTISTIDGSATNRFYNYTDNGLKNGVNYYRLKMIDEAGTITYSRTVAIMNGVKGLLLTSLIPTVITNKASLTVVASAAQKMDVIIIDMQGRLVQKQNYTLGPGNTTIPVNMAGLGAGVYQMAGITAEGKTNTIRFIKQ